MKTILILSALALSDPGYFVTETKIVNKQTDVLNIVIMPESAALKAGGGKQFCAYARLSDGKVYGVTYSNGKRTFDYAYCRNNYKLWFRKYERTSVFTTAIYDDPFGGLVRNPLLVKV